MKTLFILVIYTLSTALAFDAQFDFKIEEIHRLLKSEKWNCSDVIDYFFQRAYEFNPNLNAIISFNPKAMEEAHELDAYYFFQQSNRFIGKLHCVPFLVKDNVDVKGLPTTGGVKALRYSIPNTDATVVERIKREGGIIIGKTNLAELTGSKYESELGGACRNPWDLSRTCGTSSAGAAVGVATGMTIIGIGTDNDGSVLNPAANCGVYGLRPAVDEMSTFGMIPSFERQDTFGPYSRSVDDLVLTYSVMLGRSTFYDDYKSLNGSKFKIGYLKRFFTTFTETNQYGNFTYVINSQINSTIYKALDHFESLNFDIVRMDFTEKEFKMFLDLSIFIVIAHTSAYDACIRHGIDKYFSDETRFQFDSPYRSFESFRKSPLLTKEWRVYFNNALLNTSQSDCKAKLDTYDDYRKKYIDIFETWLQRADVDVVIFPTANDLPERLNETESFSNINPMLISPFLGYPALNLPIGYTKATKDAPKGMPIGLLMLTRNTNLLKAFRIAKLYEESYSTTSKLPHSTPILTIEEKCEQKIYGFSLASFNKSSTLILIVSLFYTLLSTN